VNLRAGSTFVLVPMLNALRAGRRGGWSFLLRLRQNGKNGGNGKN
jgi:hypothetical protein